MQKSNPSDPELLSEWLKHQRESAFRELVARYAGLVQATARRSCRDESMANEVSQLTFITLARRAKSLTSCTSIGGWLHRTAILHSKNIIRQNQRENRKRQSLAMETQRPSHDETWQEMQPVLDEALAALSEKDREALLLRFYRSLTIREVAATLGIATDAAQKRINRATQRLRSKLIRRGCKVSSSLGAAMLAGFASDTQAATLSVSTITSKAIAAGAITTGTFPTVAALMTSLKSTSVIVPLILLSVAVCGIATQRISISRLKTETSELHRQIDSSDQLLVATSSRPKSEKRFAAVDDRIDWKEFVRRFAEQKERGGGRMRSEEMGWIRIIEHRLQSMSKDQLSAELTGIAALDIDPPYHDLIKEMIMTPLIKKAPELGLMKFMENPSFYTDNWSEPQEALKQWAIKSPFEATDWLDVQIANGKLDSKALDGKNALRILFERALIGVLLASDPYAATRRLGQLPPNQRADVLLRQPIEQERQKAFAETVRQQVPATDQIKVIAELVFQEVPKKGYATATESLNRIEATPDERTASIEYIAISQFQQLNRNRKITSSDVDELREWTESVSPESTNALTAIALGRAIDGGGRQTSFTDLGELAIQYSQANGNDEILIGFLKNPTNYIRNKDQVLTLTSKISDEAKRKEVLDLLDIYFPKR